MEQTSLFNIYLEKQRKFVALVKEIQSSLNSKEYKNQGYSLGQYSKMRWNISQAQAYRYLVCAKVLDQLEEFEIKPAYESICKSLHTVAKSQIQMKLLWSTILSKTGGRPDCINSTHINQYWKELCMNKKYSNICHYQNEKDIMSKIEKSLNKYSNEKKHKQLNSKYQNKTNELKQYNSYPSPTLSSASDISGISNMTNSSSYINNIYNSSSISEDSIIYSNDNSNYIYSLSPSSSYTIPSLPTTEPIYYVPIQNQLSYSYGQSLVSLTY